MSKTQAPNQCQIQDLLTTLKEQNIIPHHPTPHHAKHHPLALITIIPGQPPTHRQYYPRITKREAYEIITNTIDNNGYFETIHALDTTEVLEILQKAKNWTPAELKNITDTCWEALAAHMFIDTKGNHGTKTLIIQTYHPPR